MRNNPSLFLPSPPFSLLFPLSFLVLSFILASTTTYHKPLTAHAWRFLWYKLVLTNHIVEKLSALLLLTNHIVVKLIAPLYPGLQYVLYSEIQYDCTRYAVSLLLRRTRAYNIYSTMQYSTIVPGMRIKLILLRKVIPFHTG
jgi:hypothetical protein